MAVFWDAAPCSLIHIDRRFGGTYCLHHQGGLIAVMVEAVSFSETSVNIYQTTLRNMTEDSHLHTRRRENLKSHHHRNKLRK
jgi:hypothetical protein